MDLMIQYAMQFVGTPYKWGGATPIQGDGIDCSGFVQCVLAFAGEDPSGDQTAQGLFDYFSQHGSVNKYGAGALAFYGKDVKNIIHVAFCVDNYRILEAGGGGSKVIDTASAIANEAYVRGRLIKYRSDFLCVVKPHYLKIGMI